MKKNLITPAFLFFSTILCAQQKDIQKDDSLISNPTLGIRVSTPQPRLKQTFQISIDAGFLKDEILESMNGKLKLSPEGSEPDRPDDYFLTLNVLPTKKGITEIGPLKFTINGISYLTNKVPYEVMDALPNVDKGLWFRKVNLSDSTFCIIIEQRIPAINKTTITGNQTKYSTTSDEIARFKYTYTIQGLEPQGSTGNSNFGHLYDSQGNLKEYKYGYVVYYFIIVDKKIKIKITKDKFEYIPEDYKFEDIIIQ